MFSYSIVDIIKLMDLDIRDFPIIKARSEMNEIYFICSRSKREMQDSAIFGYIRCSSAGVASSVDWEPSSISALYRHLEKIYGGAYRVAIYGYVYT